MQVEPLDLIVGIVIVLALTLGTVGFRQIRASQNRLGEQVDGRLGEMNERLTEVEEMNKRLKRASNNLRGPGQE